MKASNASALLETVRRIANLLQSGNVTLAVSVLQKSKEQDEQAYRDVVERLRRYVHPEDLADVQQLLQAIEE